MPPAQAARFLPLRQLLQQHRRTRRLLAPLLTVGILLLGAACADTLPSPPQWESPATPFTIRTLILRGRSSNGTYSNVRQVNTGPNSFSFVETWFLGGGKTMQTAGHGHYEPSTLTSIYTYTKPVGVVVVSTKDGEEKLSTVDTVLNSTIPLFKSGDKITYELRN